MPNVSATPRQMGNGDVITQFFDSIGTSADTYTYPKTQEKLVIRNMGPASLSVTVAGVTQVIPKHDKWEKVVDFTSFSINAVTGISAFDAWADERGSTFDTPEGQYFQNNGGGGGSGGGSITFETMTEGEVVTVDTSITPTVPSIPTGLTANPQSTQVSLTWNATSGATSYKVYRGGTLVASPTSAAYTDTGLTNGTQYSYTVSAVNTAGESSQSSAVTATPVAPSLPSVPTGLAATTGNTQVALTWNTVSGATSYKVYRGGSLVNSPTSTNYTDTGLTNDTSYSYTVSAVNGAGESAQSSSVSATPTAPAVTVLTSDSFVRADNASSLGTTDIANGGSAYAWTAVAGTWGISSNQAYQPSNTTISVAVVDPGNANGSVEAKFAAYVNGTKIIWRCVDANNHYMVQVAAGGYAVYKRKTGGYNLLNNTGIVGAVNDVLKATFNGTTMTVYRNGTQIYTFTDTDFQTATKHGIGSDGSTSRHKDFKVTS